MLQKVHLTLASRINIWALGTGISPKPHIAGFCILSLWYVWTKILQTHFIHTYLKWYMAYSPSDDQRDHMANTTSFSARNSVSSPAISVWISLDWLYSPKLFCAALTNTARPNTPTRDHAATRPNLSPKASKSAQISRASSQEGDRMIPLD